MQSQRRGGRQDRESYWASVNREQAASGLCWVGLGSMVVRTASGETIVLCLTKTIASESQARNVVRFSRYSVSLIASAGDFDASQHWLARNRRDRVKFRRGSRLVACGRGSRECQSPTALCVSGRFRRVLPHIW